jgi:hypothetical protein
VLKLIAKLFAAETCSTPNTKASLTLDAMETRYAPASIANPATINVPNPEGRATNPAATRTFVVEGGRPATPGEANGIIAILHPTSTRGFVVEGG